MDTPTWQLGTMVLIAVLAPPLTGLILTLATYMPQWLQGTEPFDFGGFFFTYLAFAVPAAYVFGFVPAFLTGAAYCVLLTVAPRLRISVPVRGLLGAALGGLVGGGVFWYLGLKSIFFAGACAAPALLLALLLPRRLLTSGWSDLDE